MYQWTRTAHINTMQTILFSQNHVTRNTSLSGTAFSHSRESRMKMYRMARYSRNLPPALVLVTSTNTEEASIFVLHEPKLLAVVPLSKYRMQSRFKYSPHKLAKVIGNALEVLYSMRQRLPLCYEIGTILLPD